MMDCWNTIGVQGNHSCMALDEHIHCRNCPVYVSAARAVLDGAQPAGYATRGARHFANLKDDNAGDTESVLIFRIGEEWLALPTHAVSEITELRPIHSLPHKQGGIVLGLASIRGELRVCVSLARLLSIDAAPVSRAADTQPKTRLLVMHRDGVRVVTVADEVDGIHRVRPEDVKPAPATVARSASPHTRGVMSLNGQAVGLLDDRLLFQGIQGGLA